MKKTFFLILSAFTLFSCNVQPAKEVSLLDKSEFSQFLDGIPVELFTLKNSNGMVAEITNFGGRIVSLWAPDKHGNLDDVVLGYSKLSPYLGSKEPYLGATIGRNAGRISEGAYTLNGEQFLLSQNEEYTHLNGGQKGFNYVIWVPRQTNESQLHMTYYSRKGEELYSSELTVRALYTLTDDNELKIEYWAKADTTTHVNISRQDFFNLDGAASGSILDHKLTINGSSYAPVDQQYIPTGELLPVKGTPFDFTKSTKIGKKIEDEDDQLLITNGYDHNWELANDGDVTKLAARIVAPKSKRTLEVYTNQPSLQFYSGNNLSIAKGKDDLPYEKNGAFTISAMHFPNTPNIPAFPTTVLEGGEEYYSVVVYKF